MKVFLWIFGAIIVLGLIIWGFTRLTTPVKSIASYSASDPNAPKIELNENNFVFGKISLSNNATHDFKIKNTGKNPLVITDLMTSCHCTSAILKVPGQPNSPEFGMMSGESNWQGEIAPGAEATIETIYKPSVMPVKGPVSRVITFRTNDPNNKEIQLEITADVE